MTHHHQYRRARSRAAQGGRVRDRTSSAQDPQPGGDGANARKSIGITVFSGMLASTFLAVLFVPSFD
jgi:hypothetical protein